jgi:hypothetical protein
MNDHPFTFIRSGTFVVGHSKTEVFPLLCPKMEEKWIPGWECKVLSSKSGFNEPGAVFKTTKPFGAELIWFTHVYDQDRGQIEFIIYGVDAYVFKFNIAIREIESNLCELAFLHSFISISDRGNSIISAIKAEDFQARLNGLGKLIEVYLNK